MTQPIDVAYVEIVPETKSFKRVLSKEIDHELKKIEKEAQSSSDKISDSFKQAGQNISGVFADKNGRLRDARGKFVAAGAAAGEQLAGGLQQAGQAAQGASKQVSGLLSGLGSIGGQGPAGIATLVVAFGALAVIVPVAAAAVQSFGIIAGAALAALPGLIGAALAGFGIMAAALHGVGAAFEEQGKKADKAGGAAVNNSRQIADAQRAVLQAEKDLVKAREDELDRIVDIRIELNRARVSEARAIDDVKNAELELADARKLNSPRAVNEAQLRLDEANATLLEAKDRTKDLTKEKEKSDRVGVEGSDKVLAAQEALRDAQDRLAQSQQKVGAAAAASNVEFNKLSKSAQGFVTAILAAKDALKPLQLAIQEAFFSGTGPLIQPIVDNLNELQPEITKVAGAFGGIFQELLKFLGSDAAKESLGKILDGLGNFLTMITPAIGPLLEAFAGLAGDSGEFGDELGGAVASGLLKIADFVSKVDLKQLFKDAKTELDKWLPTIKSIASITLKLFDILAKIGNILLPLVEDQLNVIDVAFSAFQNTFNIITEAVSRFIDLIGTSATTAVEKVKTVISSIPATISGLGKKMVQAGKDFLNSFFEGFGIAGAGDFIANFAKSFANSIIRLMNRFVLSPLNEGIAFVQSGINKIPLFGSVSLPKIPQIPQLEKGGLAVQQTMALIGEKGKKEAVLPLEDSRAMEQVGSAIAGAGGGGGYGDITVIAYLGDEQVMTKQVKVVKTINKRTARSVKQKPRMV